MKEILDLTLREILEKYCMLYSAECCYVYGITTHESFGEIAEEYDLEDEPSLVSESLINFELLVELEDKDSQAEIMTTQCIRDLIDNNLMIEKKEKTG